MMSSADSSGHAKSLEKSQQRSEVVRSVIGILESQKQFRNIKVLGRGTYGDVHLMYDPDRESAIAVKIVTSENISESELFLWPKLHHPNIITLLEFLTLSPLDVAIFIMPVQRTTLNDVLYERRFIRSYDSLDKVKAWLYQILCGLEYLNSKELCHLDIKVDNVLISNASVAMLCDFSFLNVTTKPLKRYDLGLPYIYRPPEACQSMGLDIRTDGPSYDSWGYGMMIVEVFTHFYLANSIPNSNCWLKDVYPTLFDILQEDHFLNLMVRTFVGVHIRRDHAKQALNFIHGFLMVDFEKRVSSLEATQHPFLKKGTISAPPPDCIWRRKLSTDAENIAWFKKKCTRNLTTKDENIYSEDEIFEIVEYDDIEYDASEESSYFHSSDTDDESKHSFDDELSGDMDSIIGEPNKISFQDYIETYDIKNNDVLDIELNDEVRMDNSTEKAPCSNKFKSYKNSLQRLRTCKNLLPRNAENGHHDRCDETIDNERVYDLNGDWITSSLTSINLKSLIRQDCSSSPIENVDKHNIISEFNATFKEDSPVSKIGLFPDYLQTHAKSESIAIDSLSKDSGNMESTSVFVDDLSVIDSNITYTTILDYDHVLEGKTYVSKETVEEDISIDVKFTKCSSEEFSNIPSTDSKWATGDSIKSGNSPEKISSNEYAAIDDISVVKQVKCMRQRLSKLDQMFGEMEKVMICENCSNISKHDETNLNLEETKLSEISDIAASGENCYTGDIQNSFQDVRKYNLETYSDSQMNSQSVPGHVSEIEYNLSYDSPNFQYSAQGYETSFEEEINNNNIVGSGRKTGRRRKLIQWIRYKYLDMERIVKRWPYKIMKDQR